MYANLPVIAGFISTICFLLSELPMLSKAFRSKNMVSYSPANLLMANAGNLVHSIYIYSLPPGPIWVLHSFYLVSAALMLSWYLRYERHPSGTAKYPTALPHPGNEWDCPDQYPVHAPDGAHVGT